MNIAYGRARKGDSSVSFPIRLPRSGASSMEKVSYIGTPECLTASLPSGKASKFEAYIKLSHDENYSVVRMETVGEGRDFLHPAKVVERLSREMERISDKEFPLVDRMPSMDLLELASPPQSSGMVRVRLIMPPGTCFYSNNLEAFRCLGFEVGDGPDDIQRFNVKNYGPDGGRNGRGGRKRRVTVAYGVVNRFPENQTIVLRGRPLNAHERIDFILARTTDFLEGDPTVGYTYDLEDVMKSFELSSTSEEEEDGSGDERVSAETGGSKEPIPRRPSNTRTAKEEGGSGGVVVGVVTKEDEDLIDDDVGNTTAASVDAGKTVGGENVEETEEEVEDSAVGSGEPSPRRNEEEGDAINPSAEEEEGELPPVFAGVGDDVPPEEEGEMESSEDTPTSSTGPPRKSNRPGAGTNPRLEKDYEVERPGGGSTRGSSPTVRHRRDREEEEEALTELPLSVTFQMEAFGRARMETLDRSVNHNPEAIRASLEEMFIRACNRLNLSYCPIEVTLLNEKTLEIFNKTEEAGDSTLTVELQDELCEALHVPHGKRLVFDLEVPRSYKFDLTETNPDPFFSLYPVTIVCRNYGLAQTYIENFGYNPVLGVMLSREAEILTDGLTFSNDGEILNLEFIDCVGRKIVFDRDYTYQLIMTLRPAGPDIRDFGLPKRRRMGMEGPEGGFLTYGEEKRIYGLPF